LVLVITYFLLTIFNGLSDYQLSIIINQLKTPQRILSPRGNEKAIHIFDFRFAIFNWKLAIDN